MNICGDVTCCHANLPTKCLPNKRQTTLWDGVIGLPFPHPTNTCNATHASYHIYTSHGKKKFIHMVLCSCQTVDRQVDSQFHYFMPLFGDLKHYLRCYMH